MAEIARSRLLRQGGPEIPTSDAALNIAAADGLVKALDYLLVAPFLGALNLV